MGIGMSENLAPQDDMTYTETLARELALRVLGRSRVSLSSYDSEAKARELVDLLSVPERAVTKTAETGLPETWYQRAANGLARKILSRKAAKQLRECADELKRATQARSAETDPAYSEDSPFSVNHAQLAKMRAKAKQLIDRSEQLANSGEKHRADLSLARGRELEGVVSLIENTARPEGHSYHYTPEPTDEVAAARRFMRELYQVDLPEHSLNEVIAKCASKRFHKGKEVAYGEMDGFREVLRGHVRKHSDLVGWYALCACGMDCETEDEYLDHVMSIWRKKK